MLQLVALSVIHTVMLQKLIKVIYFTGLQEVYISQRCVELRHRHVGSDVIRRAAILGHEQPGCKKNYLQGLRVSLYCVGVSIYSVGV